MRCIRRIITLLATLTLPTTALAQSSSPPPESSSSPAPSEAPSGAPPEASPAPPPSPPPPRAALTGSPPPASSAPAEAAHHAPDDGEPQLIGPTSEALDRIPGAATVLTAQDIARFQPLTTGEMLRRIPGVFVRPDDPTWLRVSIGTRGLDPSGSQRVLVLEDGIPIAPNPYGHPDLDYLPSIDRIQRIEMVRGAGSAMFGPQTMGGVINFVTAPPPLHETISLRAFGGEYGEFTTNWIYGVQGTYGTTIGNVGMLFSILRRASAGYASNPWETTDVLAKFRLSLGARTVLTARLGFTDDGSATQGLGLTTPIFQQDARANPFAYNWMRVQRFSASLTHEYRIQDDVRVRTTAFGYITSDNRYRQLFDSDPVDGLAYVRILGQPGIAGGALYLRNANQIRNAQYQVFGIEPRVQAGIRPVAGIRNELEVSGRILLEQSTSTDSFGTTAYARTGDAVHAEDSQGYGAALRLADRALITDHLTVMAVGGVESHGFSRLIRRDQFTDTYLLATAITAQFVWGANVSYSFPGVTAFAGVHLGYAPLRVDQALDPHNPSYAVNPEQSFNYEVGLRTNVTSWIRAEATGFMIDVQNPVMFGTTPLGGTGWYNGDEEWNPGGEALVQADFGRLFHTPHNVFVSARYMFVDARYVSGQYRNNFVPYAPENTLVASAGYDHPIGISFSASWLYVSSEFADAANTQVPSTDGRTGLIPAYNSIDLAASYTHHDTGLGISATLKNLLDQPYIASRDANGIMPSGFRYFLISVRWDH